MKFCSTHPAHISGEPRHLVWKVIREVIAIAERDQSPFRSDSAGTNGGVSVNRETGAGTDLCPYPADPTFDELGYKILLYIKRCFRGRVLGISTPLSEVEIAKVSPRGTVWDLQLSRVSCV